MCALVYVYRRVYTQRERDSLWISLRPASGRKRPHRLRWKKSCLGILSTIKLAVSSSNGRCSVEISFVMPRLRFSEFDIFLRVKEISRRSPRILNVISHVAAGCHDERKVSQGHEFADDDWAEKVRSPSYSRRLPKRARNLSPSSPPPPPLSVYSSSRSPRPRVGISIFAKRRRLIFRFNNRDVRLEREPRGRRKRERERRPRVRRREQRACCIQGIYVYRPRINAYYIALHVSLKTRVAARWRG